jgi:hypothetical protein
MFVSIPFFALAFMPPLLLVVLSRAVLAIYCFGTLIFVFVPILLFLLLVPVFVLVSVLMLFVLLLVLLVFVI